MKHPYVTSEPEAYYGPVIKVTTDAAAKVLKAHLTFPDRPIRGRLKMPNRITTAEIEVFSALLDLEASAANDR